MFPVCLAQNCNLHEESGREITALSLADSGSLLDNNEILHFHSQLQLWKLLPEALQNPRWHLKAPEISIILKILLQYQLSENKPDPRSIKSIGRYMSSPGLQTCITAKLQGCYMHTSVSEGQRPWLGGFPMMHVQAAKPRQGQRPRP